MQPGRAERHGRRRPSPHRDDRCAEGDARRSRGELCQHDHGVMRPALGHIDAVEPDVLRVARNAGDHLGPGLKGSEPDAETHAGNHEPSASGESSGPDVSGQRHGRRDRERVRQERRVARPRSARPRARRSGPCGRAAPPPRGSGTSRARALRRSSSAKWEPSCSSSRSALSSGTESRPSGPTSSNRWRVVGVTASSAPPGARTRAISAGLRGANTLRISAATPSRSGRSRHASAPTAAARGWARAARRRAGADAIEGEPDALREGIEHAREVMTGARPMSTTLPGAVGSGGLLGERLGAGARYGRRQGTPRAPRPSRRCRPDRARGSRSPGARCRTSGPRRSAGRPRPPRARPAQTGQRSRSTASRSTGAYWQP